MSRRFYPLLVIGAIVAVAAVCLSIGLGYLPQSRTGAQTNNLPSSKTTMQLGNINVMDARLGTLSGQTASSWQNVMSGTMKTSQQKDLMMTAAMEIGLYTRTLVSSKLGISDSSSALAGVEVRMVVDQGTNNEQIAIPGNVVFGRRNQQLTATFQGLIDGCLKTDPTTGGIIIDPTCVQPETLDLVLDTMNANSFVFACPNMTAGVHTMKVQARMVLNTSFQNGAADARCLIGKGSMSVEEVRLVKGYDITM